MRGRVQPPRPSAKEAHPRLRASIRSTPVLDLHFVQSGSHDVLRKEQEMSKLNTIVVVHTTAKVSRADHDGNFDLAIYTTDSDEPVVKDFRDITGVDEREQGQTDAYHFDVSGNEIDSDNIASIEMRMVDHFDDNWIPSSIFVVGLARNRSYVLGAHPQWSRDNAFDEGTKSHVISGSF